MSPDQDSYWGLEKLENEKVIVHFCLSTEQKKRRTDFFEKCAEGSFAVV